MIKIPMMERDLKIKTLSQAKMLLLVSKISYLHQICVKTILTCTKMQYFLTSKESCYQMLKLQTISVRT